MTENVNLLSIFTNGFKNSGWMRGVCEAQRAKGSRKGIQKQTSGLD